MPAFALTALRHWKLIGLGLLCVEALMRFEQTANISRLQISE